LIFFVYERGKTGRILEPGVKSLTHTHTHTQARSVLRIFPAYNAACSPRGPGLLLWTWAQWPHEVNPLGCALKEHNNVVPVYGMMNRRVCNK